MIKESIISHDEKYRYELTRIWDENRPLIGYILHNPATADSDNDDKTIKTLRHYSELWGYGGFVVCNLFAYRDTDLKKDKKTLNMLKKYDDPIGKDNIKYIKKLIIKTNKIVYGWGSKVSNSDQKIVRKLVESCTTPYCFQICSDGNPSHPVILGYKNYKYKIYT
jgi:hypothetical protein